MACLWTLRPSSPCPARPGLWAMKYTGGRGQRTRAIVKNKSGLPGPLVCVPLSPSPHSSPPPFPLQPVLHLHPPGGAVLGLLPPVPPCPCTNPESQSRELSSSGFPEHAAQTSGLTFRKRNTKIPPGVLGKLVVRKKRKKSSTSTLCPHPLPCTTPGGACPQQPELRARRVHLTTGWGAGGGGRYFHVTDKEAEGDRIGQASGPLEVPPVWTLAREPGCWGRGNTHLLVHGCNDHTHLTDGKTAALC